MKRLVAALALGWLCGAGQAATLAPPPASFTQRLGAELPLSGTFVDADGRALTLSDAFGSKPVVLVLGYWRCPNLCGLAMHGVLEALAGTGLPRSGYRVLGVSIDPDETPADARARQRVDADYAAQLAPGSAEPLDLRLLVGSAASVEALATSVGFGHVRDDAGGASRYAHPAGFVVLTPDGRVSRYFFGVRFDARALRLALVEAAAGRIGDLADRLLLLCAHFDPRTGRYSGAVLAGLRGVGLALALALAGYAWRHRRP
jgi:protein SCO1/2